MFNDTIPENSTIYEWLSFRTSQISGLISVTTISVIGGLPVSHINSDYNLIQFNLINYLLIDFLKSKF